MEQHPAQVVLEHEPERRCLREPSLEGPAGRLVVEVVENGHMAMKPQASVEPGEQADRHDDR